MSLTQAGGWVPKAYLRFNPGAQRHVEKEADGSVLLSGRTEAQERRFQFALFETTRLYAFRPAHGPTVIILPDLAPPESFPESEWEHVRSRRDFAGFCRLELPEPGEITWEENTVCQPPRREQKSAWGFSKSIKYENAGWPCAEYALSRMNQNIANCEDEPVRRVEAECMLLAC